MLTFHATAQFIHAMITTRLDFYNNILYNLPNNKIGRLLRIQNQAARMLTRSPRRKLITKYEQATVRTRWTQDCFLLAIPPISKTCAAIFFERSFLYAAPTLWNKLSIDIRMLEFNQF